MSQSILFSHQELFPLSDRIKSTIREELSNEVMLILSCFINSCLHQKRYNEISDLTILNLFLVDTNDDFSKRILFNLSNAIDKIDSKKFSLFFGAVTFRIISDALVSSNLVLDDIESLKIEKRDVENYIELYFIYQQDYLAEFSKINSQTKKEDRKYFFRRNVWPIISNQLFYSFELNPLFEFYKFSNYIKFLVDNRHILKIDFEPFIKRYNIDPINYSWNFLNLYVEFNKKNDSKNFSNFILNAMPDIEIYHSHIFTEIDIAEIKQNSLKIFKRKPLLRSGNKILVFDWQVYLSKLYFGFIVDSHKFFGIDKDYLLPDFLSKIGKRSAEHLFKTILNSMKGKFRSIETHALPGFKGDSIFFKDNKIVLLEYKDYRYSDNISCSSNYEDIENYLNLRFVLNSKGKKKGIYQIYEYVKYIFNNIDIMPPPTKNYKPAKIKIYSFIVVDDKSYLIPGFEEYLRDKLHEKFEDDKFDLKENVKFFIISLEKLYVCSQIGMCISDIINACDSYYKYKHHLWKKVIKTNDVEFLNKFFVGFEGFLSKEFSTKKIKPNLNELIQELGLIETLNFFENLKAK